MAQPIEGILETALYATDLDAAEAFYGNVLGLEKIARLGNRHVFFRCGPEPGEQRAGRPTNIAPKTAKKTTKPASKKKKTSDG